MQTKLRETDTVRLRDLIGIRGREHLGKAKLETTADFFPPNFLK